jgi:LCP family protein required for cell wall assembly
VRGAAPTSAPDVRMNVTTSDDDRAARQGSRALPPRLDPRVGRPPRRGAAAEAGGPDSGPVSPSRRPRAAAVARVVAGVLSAVLLCSSGWGWYLGRVAEATVNRTDAIPTTGNSDGSQVSEAMNLLLVGSDSRTTLTPEQMSQLHTGGDSGLNTDTMILVHVPADGSKASFVSFPRDSYVAIPGHGNDKLNSAYAYGYTGAGDVPEAEKRAAGARLLVQTISQLTGLGIDHYLEADLLGFFNLSSVVGGVEVNLCKAVDDHKYSGAVFPAGVQVITGADALKFVRQRHGLPRGDFDRIVRQQVFMAGVLRKMVSQDVLLDLSKQRQLVSAAAQSVTVDQTLDFFQLAQQMQSISPGSIDFQTIPYVGDDKDDQGRYILRLASQDKLHTFFAQLSADPQPAAPAAQTTTAAAAKTIAPADVKVGVFNGSGRVGLAASAAGGLQAAGFQVTGTANADKSTYTRTEIRYAAGDEALAAAVAASIPGASKVKSANAVTGTVQVVLGSDFTAVGQKVTTTAAPSSAASSTAGSSTAGSSTAGGSTATGEGARTAADTSCIN